jgi:hypothetical protein
MLIRPKRLPASYSPFRIEDKNRLTGSTPRVAGDANTSKQSGSLRRLGVLWSDDRVLHATGPFQGTGVQVACSAWIKAIVDHGRIASIDVFAPRSAMEACRQEVQAAEPATSENRAPHLRLHTNLELRSLLQESPLSVLHDPGMDLLAGSYARARFSRRVFPVTCSQHGISYTFMLHTHFTPQLTALLYPCDAIVCLSRAAKSLYEKG